MLVDVVAVLEVPVPVVDVVDVIVMLHRFASVAHGVRRSVIGVHLRLGVALAIMDMVYVVAMLNGFVAVTW